MGMSTAEILKPMPESHQEAPDRNPSWGGRIRLPAPKKRENRASASTKSDLRFIGLVNSVLIATFPPLKHPENLRFPRCPEVFLSKKT